MTPRDHCIRREHVVSHLCKAGRIIAAAVRSGEIRPDELVRHVSVCAVPSCPGGGEYGHGMSRTVVHAGGCCERWQQRQPDDSLEAAFWDFDAARKSGEERLAFKNVVRALLVGPTKEDGS